MMHFNYPYYIDQSGRTAVATDHEHIRQLIEQILFTSLGERVNRPSFGTGLNQLVFAPNSDELAAATQLLVQGALQQWLADLIQVELVEITNRDSTLRISVQYSIKNDQQQKQMVQFQKAL